MQSTIRIPARVDVVTYRLAYLDSSRSLCAACAADPPYPLGPVQHGAHRGQCDLCAARRRAATVSDEQIRALLADGGRRYAHGYARRALRGDVEARAECAEEVVQ